MNGKTFRISNKNIIINNLIIYLLLNEVFEIKNLTDFLLNKFSSRSSQSIVCSMARDIEIKITLKTVICHEQSCKFHSNIQIRVNTIEI